MCAIFGFIAQHGRGPRLETLEAIAEMNECRGPHAFGFAWIDSRGERDFLASITRGQYEFPDGLFYGGNAPTWCNRNWRRVLRQHARGTTRLGWIDVHTGLGVSGSDERVFVGPDDEASFERAQRWWGGGGRTPVTGIRDLLATAAPASGLLWNTVRLVVAGVAAALAVGASHAVLDYVIPYVKEREAFGEPIARRQSVAFMCANIAIELDGLRLITWRGAARAEHGLPFAREAALAKKLGTDKGMQIGLDGVQLLGGHGYTKEHPVERWYRDLRAIGVAEGVLVL